MSTGSASRRATLSRIVTASLSAGNEEHPGEGVGAVLAAPAGAPCGRVRRDEQQRSSRPSSRRSRRKATKNEDQPDGRAALERQARPPSVPLGRRCSSQGSAGVAPRPRAAAARRHSRPPRARPSACSRARTAPAALPPVSRCSSAPRRCARARGRRRTGSPRRPSPRTPRDRRADASPRRRSAPGRCRRAAACRPRRPRSRSVALARDEHRLVERRRLLLDAAGVGDDEVRSAPAAGRIDAYPSGSISSTFVERLERPARARRGPRGLGCIGRTKRTSGMRRRERARRPRRCPRGRRPSSRAGGRSRGRSGRRRPRAPRPADRRSGTSRPAAQCRASMPVLPVTKIWSAGTPSRTRFSRSSPSARGASPRCTRSAGGSAPPGTASG